MSHAEPVGRATGIDRYGGLASHHPGSRLRQALSVGQRDPREFVTGPDAGDEVLVLLA